MSFAAISAPSDFTLLAIYSFMHTHASQLINRIFWALSRGTPQSQLSTRQPLEYLDSPIQRSVVDGKTQSEVGIAITEGFAGNNQQIIADRFGNELTGGSPRGFGKHVEGPARLGQLVTRFEGLVKPIALAMIVGDVRGIVEVQGGDTGVLNHARSADEGELLQLSHFFNDRAGSVSVAEPPTGHAVRLAEAVKDEHVVVELGGAAKSAVVTISTVNLVTQEQDAALFGKEC